MCTDIIISTLVIFYIIFSYTVSRSNIVTQPTIQVMLLHLVEYLHVLILVMVIRTLVFTWYKQSDTLPPKYQTNEMTSGEVTISTLIIPNETKQDVGKYYCQVWANDVGVRSKKANLYYSGTYICTCILGLC